MHHPGNASENHQFIEDPVKERPRIILGKKNKEECNSSKEDLINKSPNKSCTFSPSNRLQPKASPTPKQAHRPTSPRVFAEGHLNELQLFWHIGRSWRMLKIKTTSISPSLQVLRRQSLLAIVEVVIPEKIWLVEKKDGVERLSEVKIGVDVIINSQMEM